MDCSISSSSKISEFVILDYKHLLLNPSVNLTHSYPMPKGKKNENLEFQNQKLDQNQKSEMRTMGTSSFNFFTYR